MKNYIAIIVALGLAVFSCGKREAPRTEVKPETAQITLATASFVKGQIKAWTNSAWQPLAIQQALKTGDSLEIPDRAALELKDNAGVITKLTGPAKGAVSDLIASTATQNQSAATKALAKVKKLENTKQTFQTQTPTAVAGIRGVTGRMAADTTKKDTLHK